MNNEWMESLEHVDGYADGYFAGWIAGQSQTGTLFISDISHHGISGA